MSPKLVAAAPEGLAVGREGGERGRAAAGQRSIAATAQANGAQRTRKDDRLEFVLVNRDRHGVTMSGSSQDAERLKRQYGDERVLWFRHDGKAYVVKDAAALDEAEQINRPVADIGAKQGEIGAKQGAIGAKQGAVGARQGEIGARQGAIGAKQGHDRRAASGARRATAGQARATRSSARSTPSTSGWRRR